MVTRPFKVVEVWPFGNRMRMFASVSVAIMPINAVAAMVNIVLLNLGRIKPSKPRRENTSDFVSKLPLFLFFLEKR